MKVLLICKYSGTAEFQRPSRQIHISQALAERGHDVMLISSRSDGTRTPSFHRLVRAFVQDRFTHLQTNGPLINLGLNIKRLFSWVWFELTVFLCFNRIRKFAPDVVVVSSLSILSLVTACIVKKIFRIPLVIDVRDIYPMTLVEVGKFSKNSLIYRILSVIERFAYNQADHFMSPLENFDKHVWSVTKERPLFTWIPMGYSEFIHRAEISKLASEICDFVSDLKLSDRFVCGYAGSIGLVNDLERLFHLAEHLEPLRIDIVFIGDGPLRNYFSQKFGKKSNIFMFPPVPKADISTVLSKFDILLHPIPHNNLYQFGVSPNKWIDYSLSGRPFLTTLQDRLKVAMFPGNIFFTENNSDAALLSKIIDIRNMDPDVITRMGEMGREYVLSNLHYSVLSKDFEDLLNKAVEVFFNSNLIGCDNYRFRR